MRKTAWYVLLALAASLRCPTAQTLDPALIASAGNSAKAGSFDVDWSLGETVIGPFGSASGTTLGYQQGEDPGATSLPSPAAAAFSVRQSRGLVTLTLDPSRGSYTIRLYDCQGRVSAAYNPVPRQREFTLAARDLPPGLNLLDVSAGKEKILRGYKIMGGN
jgi:hypothetical protein